MKEVNGKADFLLKNVISGSFGFHGNGFLRGRQVSPFVRYVICEWPLITETLM